jgi:uncharacterized protein YbcC (UPF0753/DUF2309 family)
LPAQGPITVFIHHNTLHAFEDLPFHEAVKKAMQVFGCQPYLTEDRYREELGRGRIRFADVHVLLAEDLRERAREQIAGLATRLELRLAMLLYPLRTAPTGELLWLVAETDALRRIRPEASSAVRQRLVAETRRWAMRDLRGGNEAAATGTRKRGPARVPVSLAAVVERFSDSAVESWSDQDWESFTLQLLWRVCCNGVTGVPPYVPVPPAPIRHRKLLLDATGADSDLLVHELLIRFSAAFLDQGLAPWKLPRRDDGFYQSFCVVYGLTGGPPDPWLCGIERELRRLQEEGVSPLDSIHQSLDLLGVTEPEWEDFISFTLLALRGFGGMVRQTEVRGDRVVQPAPAGSLVEFLAVRLLLDRWALAYTARHALGYTGPLCRLRHELHKHSRGHEPPSTEQRAFLVFQLAQVLGWAPEDLHRLNQEQWCTLLREIEGFSRLERRRVFHLAYERRFYTQALDAVALHAANPAPTPRRPRFQAMFCIDEREESIRRHLEELAPDVETFGVAGFFFIPMYYRGADDAHFVPLCPAVVWPQYWVIEQIVAHVEEARSRARTRRALGMAQHRFHLGSRSFALGAILAAAVGILASIPLVMRTLFPRLTARIRRRFGRIVHAPPVSRLLLERSQPTPGPDPGQIGLTLDEMAAIAERVLRDIGLTSGFSRLVLTLGHGSTSMNNPHESAHDCGACGGARGGPNGRAIAQILNDARIRERLARNGIAIPPETFFVGGMHNTSSETVTFYDVDCVPDSHRHDFEVAQAIMETACDRDAHERSRRFHSAPLTMSFPAARQHVEGRAEDLAQVRPEWGHATNAISIVGRRAFTRGLFLDRRAFLTSYHPTQDDDEGTILTRILLAVFPVCAGINLEYYFSYVDNTGWGCGTKLPHNITSLVGVMDGAASDLRTGLPWQMVEIHEPVRLLNIIETTPEMMLGILERQPPIARLCRNGWVHLAVLHPETRRISLFHNGSFQEYHPRAAQLPRATSSLDWYRGCRDHLEFASIEP